MNSGEWTNCRLSEIAEIVMGQSPSGETCNNGGIGVPLLNGPTEFGSHSPSPVQFTSDPKKKSKKNDILFCVRGSTTGRMNWSDQEFAIGRGLAAIRSRTSTNLQYFIKGIIDHNLNQILGASTGSTFPNVSRDQLNNLEIFIPTNKEEQFRIASILSSFDDKIELNFQMNKTLEAIAQAIFKEWFVDFRFPGFDGMLVDGLPKGWRKGTLKELIEVKNGYAFKGTDFIETGVPVIKIKNVKPNKILLNILSYVSREVADTAKRYRINRDDILITMSGNRIDGTPDTWVGKVALFNREGEFLLNQRVSVLKIIDPISMSKYYLTQVLSSVDFQYFFISNATSSGGQANISPDLVYNTELIIPKPEVMKLYNEIIGALFNKIFLNDSEIETLTSIRNLLLPKLMTGKIRVG